MFRCGHARRHEDVFWLQMQQRGGLWFYVLYLYYQFRYGYEKNPFELEAEIFALESWRAGQGEPAMARSAAREGKPIRIGVECHAESHAAVPH